MQNDSIEGSGAVYVQTNEPDNHVIAFARGSDGVLTENGRHATGGKGDGKPHLTSQGSVISPRTGGTCWSRTLRATTSRSSPSGWTGSKRADRGHGPRPEEHHRARRRRVRPQHGGAERDRVPHRGWNVVADRRLRADARDERGPRAGRLLAGRLDARGHERGTDAIARSRSASDGTLGEPATVRRPDRRPTASRSRRRYADRHRGLPGGEGRGGGLVVHRRRRIGDAGHARRSATAGARSAGPSLPR